MKHVTCIVCGSPHSIWQFICADCTRLADRDLIVESSKIRATINRERRRAGMTADEARVAALSDPRFIPIGKAIYAQAKARIEDSLRVGHVNEKLRKEGALGRL